MLSTELELYSKHAASQDLVFVEVPVIFVDCAILPYGNARGRLRLWSDTASAAQSTIEGLT
jgi:hypothetical protein